MKTKKPTIEHDYYVYIKARTAAEALSFFGLTAGERPFIDIAPGHYAINAYPVMGCACNTCQRKRQEESEVKG